MQNTQERPNCDDEISLVDLAATFIRRRRIFYISFLLFTLLGVAYALIQSDKYEYVTLLESAEKAGGEFIENPAATVATVKNRWIPAVISSYQVQNDRNLPFTMQPSNPENTGLIRITSEANLENAELVENTHQALAENIIERQDKLLAMQQKSLKNQVASIEQVIESLQSSEASESTGTALASAIQKRAELETNLEALKPATALVVARQSIEQKGTSSLLIVTLAVVFGGMLGVFLVFFAEFAAQVKKSLTETSED